MIALIVKAVIVLAIAYVAWRVYKTKFKKPNASHASKPKGKGLSRKSRSESIPDYKTTTVSTIQYSAAVEQLRSIGAHLASDALSHHYTEVNPKGEASDADYEHLRTLAATAQLALANLLRHGALEMPVSMKQLAPPVQRPENLQPQIKVATEPVQKPKPRPEVARSTPRSGMSQGYPQNASRSLGSGFQASRPPSDDDDATAFYGVDTRGKSW